MDYPSISARIKPCVLKGNLIECVTICLGNSTDLTGGSPESSSRGVSGTPVALDRRLDKTVLEKIERLENQDGSLDTQTFPVVPKATSVILPNPQTTANAATTDNTARTSEPPPPATYNSQVRLQVVR